MKDRLYRELQKENIEELQALQACTEEDRVLHVEEVEGLLPDPQLQFMRTLHCLGELREKVHTKIIEWEKVSLLKIGSCLVSCGTITLRGDLPHPILCIYVSPCMQSHADSGNVTVYM